MKCLKMVLCLSILGQAAAAQLVVFDNSHAPGHEMYDDFIADLTSRGYTVEKRSTPLMDNGDADVIVLMPEDAYAADGNAYTSQEAVWLMEFVDSGKGLFAGLCPNIDYWSNLLEVMDEFGIASGYYICNPAYYIYFTSHPLFAGVQEMGNEFSYCLSLTASFPSTAIASDGLHDYVACYENEARGDGAAVWVSQYRMMSDDGLDDYDNLAFLRNAFAWLSHGGDVADEASSWGEVKRLYR
ncbi:hypothetical protein KKG45_07420 [bacterium]|nr:hypothetical protein [bacterium]MBU1073061.1 hypothetical protein [bacterium]MBU1674420.1 hypothetical protein [bacterium]